MVIAPDGIIFASETYFDAATQQMFGTTESWEPDGGLTLYDGNLVYNPARLSAIVRTPAGYLLGAGRNISNGHATGFVAKSSTQQTFATPSDSSISAVALSADGTLYGVGEADSSQSRNALLVTYNVENPSSYGTIKGNVFNDKDNDRVRDPNKWGAANVRVYIDRNRVRSAARQQRERNDQ